MEIIDTLAEINPDALKANGFDDAVIGYAKNSNGICVLVYSVEKIIDILVKNHNLDYDDAYEHFEYNIEGSYMGENAPIFLHND